MLDLYLLIGDSNAGAVMTENSQRGRRAAALLFSLIMACLLGLGGLLVGMYLWGHFGRPANDPDDTGAYLCGLLVGGVMAIGGGTASLWKFWPRTSPKSSQATGS
jgi:hypothetical protein